MAKWFEQIDHTADVGFIVKAENLPVLFERAAWGMFSILTDPDTIDASQQAISVHIEASDLQALLVKWLSELNFLHITEHKLFGEFSITEFTENKLQAKVKGEDIDHQRHTIYTEIKAVTFHDLQIEQRDNIWQAQVIFDL